MVEPFLSDESLGYYRISLRDEEIHREVYEWKTTHPEARKVSASFTHHVGDEEHLPDVSRRVNHIITS